MIDQYFSITVAESYFLNQTIEYNSVYVIKGTVQQKLTGVLSGIN
jgi:hypothetical protein